MLTVQLAGGVPGGGRRTGQGYKLLHERVRRLGASRHEGARPGRRQLGTAVQFALDLPLHAVQEPRPALLLAAHPVTHVAVHGAEEHRQREVVEAGAHHRQPERVAHRREHLQHLHAATHVTTRAVTVRTRRVPPRTVGRRTGDSVMLAAEQRSSGSEVPGETVVQGDLRFACVCMERRGGGGEGAHLQGEDLLPGRAHRVAVLQLVEAADELHQDGTGVAHREDVLTQGCRGGVVVHVDTPRGGTHALHLVHEHTRLHIAPHPR